MTSANTTSTIPAASTRRQDRSDYALTLTEQLRHRVRPPLQPVEQRQHSRQFAFTLTDQLILTVDPSYQYSKANGGGTVIGREGLRIINGVEYTGFIGGQYYFGRDLNGDGDTVDSALRISASWRVLLKHQLQRRQPARAEPDAHPPLCGGRGPRARRSTPTTLVRLAFTHDYSNHRQTGQVGFLKENGEPEDVFPINDPIKDANGNIVQKRDRQSYAILNKIAAEYSGQFGALRVNVGASLPYFKRDLENFCFTTSSGRLRGLLRAGSGARRGLRYGNDLPGAAASRAEVQQAASDARRSVRLHAGDLGLRQLHEEHLGPEHGQPLQRVLLRAG